MLRAFLAAPSGIIGLVVLGLVALCALVAPLTLTEGASTLDLHSVGQNPSIAHVLGTDNLGRDILLRVLVATRLSVGLAVVATGLGALLGMVAGAGSILLPRRPRAIALRTIDALLAFPGILVAIFVSAIVGPGLLGIVLGVGIAVSFSFARVTSALSLNVFGRDYVSAARIAGIGRLRLMWRYVLPNIAETLAITFTAATSNSIAAASSLSFLGLGVQPPDFDWGRMLTEGTAAFYLVPAAALAPATAIAVTALAFGFFGEALARVMNPVLWVRRDSTVAAQPPAFGRSPTLRVDADSVAPADGEPVLTVQHLTVSFPGRKGRFQVVDDVSFGLARGDRLGIVGESGSGKTTMALAIAQLVPYPGTVTGTVELEGRDLRNLPRKQRDQLLGTDLAVVYQDPLSSLNPAVKIGTQLTEAAEIHRGMSHASAVELATARLREVNIATPERQLQRHPSELSGGMRQRVMIAMGLMTQPALLIADEPTTSLDVTIQAQIMDLLVRVNADHHTAIILISHNLALVSQTTDRVLVMYGGRVVEDLSFGELITGALHPYTQALLAAIPDMSRPREEKLAYIPGQAPDPAALPTGCAYHPRCPLAFDRCRVDRPPLRLHADARRVACWAVEGQLQ